MALGTNRALLRIIRNPVFSENLWKCHCLSLKKGGRNDSEYVLLILLDNEVDMEKFNQEIKDIKQGQSDDVYCGQDVTKHVLSFQYVKDKTRTYSFLHFVYQCLMTKQEMARSLF